MTEPKDYISQCERLGVEPTFEFLSALSDNKIRQIALANRRKPLTDDDIVCISAALQKNSSIEVLDCAGNQITKAGASELAEALNVNTTIQQLSLSNNCIEDDGVIAIAKALKKNRNTKLWRLDIRKSAIGLQGLTAIAEAVEMAHVPLRILALASNDIDDKGAIVIAAMLNSRKHQLEELDLNSNRIGVVGAKALAESLQNNTTLKRFSLQFNSIGDEGAIAIAQALQRNSSLQALCIGYNRFGADALQAFTQTLLTNKTLKILDVEGSEPTTTTNSTVNGHAVDGTAVLQLQQEIQDMKDMLTASGNEVENLRTVALKLAQQCEELALSTKQRFSDQDLRLESLSDSMSPQERELERLENVKALEARVVQNIQEKLGETVKSIFFTQFWPRLMDTVNEYQAKEMERFRDEQKQITSKIANDLSVVIEAIGSVSEATEKHIVQKNVEHEEAIQRLSSDVVSLTDVMKRLADQVDQQSAELESLSEREQSNKQQSSVLDNKQLLEVLDQRERGYERKAESVAQRLLQSELPNISEEIKRSMKESMKNTIDVSLSDVNARIAKCNQNTESAIAGVTQYENTLREIQKETTTLRNELRQQERKSANLSEYIEDMKRRNDGKLTDVEFSVASLKDEIRRHLQQYRDTISQAQQQLLQMREQLIVTKNTMAAHLENMRNLNLANSNTASSLPGSLTATPIRKRSNSNSSSNVNTSQQEINTTENHNDNNSARRKSSTTDSFPNEHNNEEMTFANSDNPLDAKKRSRPSAAVMGKPPRTTSLRSTTDTVDDVLAKVTGVESAVSYLAERLKETSNNNNNNNNNNNSTSERMASRMHPASPFAKESASQRLRAEQQVSDQQRRATDPRLLFADDESTAGAVNSSFDAKSTNGDNQTTERESHFSIQSRGFSSEQRNDESQQQQQQQRLSYVLRTPQQSPVGKMSVVTPQSAAVDMTNVSSSGHVRDVNDQSQSSIIIVSNSNTSGATSEHTFGNERRALELAQRVQYLDELLHKESDPSTIALEALMLQEQPQREPSVHQLTNSTNTSFDSSAAAAAAVRPMNTTTVVVSMSSRGLPSPTATRIPRLTMSSQTPSTPTTRRQLLH